METRTNRRQIEVEIAESAQSREACYRLRYDVYVEEMGYTEDAPQQMLHDELDETGVVFRAIQDGKTVGTLRMNYAKDCPADCQTRYGINLLSEEELDSAVVVSKLIICKEFRRTTVLLDLLSAYYDHCLHLGVEVHLIGCRESLQKLYARFGFVPHSEEYVHPIYGKGKPMIARTFDYEHLCSVRSPLAPRLALFQRSAMVAA